MIGGGWEQEGGGMTGMDVGEGLGVRGEVRGGGHVAVDASG